MRFILTTVLAVSFTLFAMDVAIKTSTTVDLLNSHAHKQNVALAMLVQN